MGVDAFNDWVLVRRVQAAVFSVADDSIGFIGRPLVDNVADILDFGQQVRDFMGGLADGPGGCIAERKNIFTKRCKKTSQVLETCEVFHAGPARSASLKRMTRPFLAGVIL